MPQYNGVWTLEQQAQAQSNQQWVTDPNFKNTTLLLQADGTGSGSQNQTFLDGSTNNFFITRNGNTTQGSFSPFSQAPGYWGNYFNGSSYHSLATGQTPLLLSNSDWTFEGWVYLTATAARSSMYSGQNDNATAAGSSYYFAVGTSSTIDIWIGTTNYAINVINPALNTWAHVAYVRTGGTLSSYLNGTRISTRSDLGTGSINNGSTTYAPQIGATAGGLLFTGYLSNLRLIKGSGGYDATQSTITVPTSPLTNVTNTSLLTCQSNRFVDNSTNAFTITPSGSGVSVQAFGPFAPALQWTPTVVGGSGYFDGNDYLGAATTLISTTATTFTMEGWIYMTAAPVSSGNIPGLCGDMLGTATTNYMSFGPLANRTLGFQWFNGSSNVTVYGNDVMALNSWNHIAVSISSSTIKLFVNGANQTLTGTTTLGNRGGTSSQFTIGYNSTQASITGYVSSLRVTSTAVYTGAFTPPTAPLTAVSGTTLLLNYTNAGIYDGKMANNLETVGNAQVATNPVKYGSGSMKFNGTSDYLASFNNVPMGTGDCTIEAWVYPTYTGSGAYAIFTTGPGGTTGNLRFGVNASTLYLDIIGASVFASTGPTIPTNVWVHMAVTRANGIWRGFINGVLMGSTSTQGTTSIVGTERYIGLLGPTGAAGNVPGGWWSGYIDDLRVTQGIARYIANFTPPQQALPRQ